MEVPKGGNKICVCCMKLDSRWVDNQYQFAVPKLKTNVSPPIAHLNACDAATMVVQETSMLIWKFMSASSAAG